MEAMNSATYTLVLERWCSLQIILLFFCPTSPTSVFPLAPEPRLPSVFNLSSKTVELVEKTSNPTQIAPDSTAVFSRLSDLFHLQLPGVPN